MLFSTLWGVQTGPRLDEHEERGAPTLEAGAAGAAAEVVVVVPTLTLGGMVGEDETVGAAHQKPQTQTTLATLARAAVGAARPTDQPY